MKKLYIAMIAVLLLCAAGTVVLTLLSPDRIPLHYNIAGEADRFGSRYQNVMWPLLTAAFGALFAALAKHERKKPEKSNEKILLITGVAALAFFTLFGFYAMGKALRYDPQTSADFTFDDLNRFVNLGVGVLLVVLGNFMPKARRNSVVGVRTQWSMESDAVWQKTQRFGGVATVAAGFLLILLSLFVPGAWNIPVLIVVIAVLAILCTVASYRYHQEEERK